MIQATTESTFRVYISTEDNRINTSVASSQIRHLFKFINDMDGSVQYAYGVEEDIYNRYTGLTFDYNADPVVYSGTTKLIPAGYWKYEVYEVSWAGTVNVAAGTAPATELDVLTPVGVLKGVVQGLVTKGILNVTEKAGDEQVQYIQNAKSVQTLTIAYAGEGYSTAPTITITGDCITQATATCTVSGGEVNTVTITDAGSGYTTNPTVTVTGGGADTDANITADIEQTNYIYYGQ
jgi:hypothetical protein